jgi:lipid-A-disaccharide synthase
MIIAGEVSGDMHAAPLVEAIRERLPAARFFGIGGNHMRAAGVDTVHGIEDMAVMGFSEVVLRYRYLMGILKEMAQLAADRKPDAVILVDYPGFNLRLARQIHERGIRVIYYICPQVWAWNRGRIPGMARIVDHLISIFPFEADHFADTGMRVSFAGHPLVDQTRSAREAPEAALPWQGRPRVALLPGSRRHEIERLLPIMVQTIPRIRSAHPDTAFLIAAPSPSEVPVIQSVLNRMRRGQDPVEIVPGKTREILRQADAAIVASGTATIEAALMRCPLLVVYRTAWLTYWLGRMLIRIPHIGMVNIVAGREVCPEFVQGRTTPRRLAKAIIPLLQDGPERRQMLEGLNDVAEALGTGGAAARAADIVVRELQNT